MTVVIARPSSPMTAAHCGRPGPAGGPARRRAAGSGDGDARHLLPAAGPLARPGLLVEPSFDYRGTGGVARAEGGDRRHPALAGDAASALEALVGAADGLPGQLARAPAWAGRCCRSRTTAWSPGVREVASGNGCWRYNAPAVRRRAPLLWHTLGADRDRRRRLLSGPPPAGRRRRPGQRDVAVAPVVPVAGLFQNQPRVPRSGRACHEPTHECVVHRRRALTAAAVDAMDDLYLGTPVDGLRLDPADAGVGRVGRRRFAPGGKPCVVGVGVAAPAGRGAGRGSPPERSRRLSRARSCFAPISRPRRAALTPSAAARRAEDRGRSPGASHSRRTAPKALPRLCDPDRRANSQKTSAPGRGRLLHSQQERLAVQPAGVPGQRAAVAPDHPVAGRARRSRSGCVRWPSPPARADPTSPSVTAS